MELLSVNPQPGECAMLIFNMKLTYNFSKSEVKKEKISPFFFQVKKLEGNAILLKQKDKL